MSRVTKKEVKSENDVTLYKTQKSEVDVKDAIVRATSKSSLDSRYLNTNFLLQSKLKICV